MNKLLGASAIVVLCFVLGACSDDNGSPSPDSTPVSDGAVSPDAPTVDGPIVTPDGPAVDGPVADGPTGQYCPVVGYSPCGGDLVATWEFRALCPDDPAAAAAVCQHPFDNLPECKGTGNEAICDGKNTGTLTFKSDMSVDIDTTVTLVTTYNFTDACLAATGVTGTTPQEQCTGMTKAGKLTCTYQTNACTCVSAPLVESDKKTVSYTIVGQDLAIGIDPPSTWCIKGDRLTMDFYKVHPASWRYWVLERK